MDIVSFLEQLAQLPHYDLKVAKLINTQNNSIKECFASGAAVQLKHQFKNFSETTPQEVASV